MFCSLKFLYPIFFFYSFLHTLCWLNTLLQKEVNTKMLKLVFSTSMNVSLSKSTTQKTEWEGQLTITKDDSSHQKYLAEFSWIYVNRITNPLTEISFEAYCYTMYITMFQTIQKWRNIDKRIIWHNFHEMSILLCNY